MKSFKPRLCEKCGCEYTPTGSGQKYCESCKAPGHRIKPPKPCKICGGKYKRTGYGQKYCESCGPSARKAKNKARMAAYHALPEVKARIAVRRATPKGRARQFLANSPDCTSTIEEIEAILSASINALTGEKGKTGRHSHELCLDHIHNGPAIALIPNWLNHILYAGMSSPSAKQYILYRLQLEGMKEG